MTKREKVFDFCGRTILIMFGLVVALGIVVAIVDPDRIPESDPLPIVSAFSALSEIAEAQPAPAIDRGLVTTPRPGPVYLEGAGDDVVSIDTHGRMCRAHITGNRRERHFAVIARGGRGNYVGLLVNTGERYDGVVLVPARARALEVQASGPWTVTLRPSR